MAICNFVIIVDTPYLVGMLMAILCAGYIALFSSSASLPLASGNKKTASASLSVSRDFLYKKIKLIIDKVSA